MKHLSEVGRDYPVEYSSGLVITTDAEIEDGPVLRSIAHDEVETHRFFNGRLLGSPQIDFNLIKGWMRRCDIHHNDCKAQSIAGIDNLLLIDVENLTVGSAPPLSSYATLSYARGKASLRTIGGSGELPYPLPKSFDDAIAVTRALEIRYLWIDAYCLPAGDGDERREALAAMGNIYKNSILTIVGAYGCVESGLPSVSLDSRPVRQAWKEINGRMLATMPIDDGWDQEGNIWRFRAWTHQEVALAGRCVYFGLHQMYFECKSDSFAESFTGSWEDDRAKLGQQIRFSHGLVEHPFQTVPQGGHLDVQSLSLSLPRILEKKDHVPVRSPRCPPTRRHHERTFRQISSWVFFSDSLRHTSLVLFFGAGQLWMHPLWMKASLSTFLPGAGQGLTDQ